MQPEAKSEIGEASARPLAELLSCPPPIASLLNASAQCIVFDTRDTIFQQGAECHGLYVVVSGQLLRKAERLEKRLTLGTTRVGDLVELAATLGDGRHTYTLVAQASGSLLMLPMNALAQAFHSYPPLRMRLLEELAREVSRAYVSCRATRLAGIRRHGFKSPLVASDLPLGPQSND
jgi:CRP-like cAMP-binding protein